MSIRLSAHRKSKVNLRMLLQNAILTAILIMPYVIGITGTVESLVESYAEQAAYNLADVAHVHRSDDMEIRSSIPQWYHKGMRIFAYAHTNWYWTKRRLTWSLINDPSPMPRELVISAMTKACEKWAAVSPFSFKQVEPIERPDIRLEAVPDDKYSTCNSEMIFNEQRDELDRDGITLQFEIVPKWYEPNHEDWANFGFTVLYLMGATLGLQSSEVPDAVMHTPVPIRSHPGITSPDDYDLTPDDIDGIQAKYGPPSPSWSPVRRRPRDSSCITIFYDANPRDNSDIL